MGGRIVCNFSEISRFKELISVYLYLHEANAFAHILSIKARGGGALKAFADMSTKNVTFLTAPLSCYYLYLIIVVYMYVFIESMLIYNVIFCYCLLLFIIYLHSLIRLMFYLNSLEFNYKISLLLSS